MDPAKVAWAAGFFEAEGCIAASGRSTVLIVGNTDPEPPCRLAAYLRAAANRAVGIGPSGHGQKGHVFA